MPTQPPEVAGRSWGLGRARWNVFEEHELSAAEGGLLLQRKPGSGSVWALGSAELWEGRHAFRFDVAASHRSEGNLHVGIADGTPEAARMPGAPKAKGGSALTFHPWDGCLYAWEDWTVGHSNTELTNVMRGADLDGEATGATIVLLIDMDEKKLHLSINGGEAVEARVGLPECVRPLVRLVHAGDAIRLVEWRQETSSVAPPVQLMQQPSAVAPSGAVPPLAPRPAATVTPSSLIAATQRVADACRGSLADAGSGECDEVERALATLDAACVAARAVLATTRERLAAAAPYEMVEERARIDAAVAAKADAVAAKAAAAPPKPPLPQAVAAITADAVRSVVHGTGRVDTTDVS